MDFIQAIKAKQEGKKVGVKKDFTELGIDDDGELIIWVGNEDYVVSVKDALRTDWEILE